MKKIILFNVLITAALFPYVVARWMHLPYSEGVWSFEIFMVYGTFLMGTLLSVTNILLLISLKWVKYSALFLRATMFFMSFLFAYPIYVGLQTGYDNGVLLADFMALAILYGNLWLSNKEYQVLRGLI